MIYIALACYGMINRYPKFITSKNINVSVPSIEIKRKLKTGRISEIS